MYSVTTTLSPSTSVTVYSSAKLPVWGPRSVSCPEILGAELVRLKVRRRYAVPPLPSVTVILRVLTVLRPSA